MQNNGGVLPAGYVEPWREQPPPPSAIDDSDILDLSMELNAASIDDVQGDLDESGIERVPMADPGLDVSKSAFDAKTRRNSSKQIPIPQVGHHENVAGTDHGLHTRRKSVLPGA